MVKAGLMVHPTAVIWKSTERAKITQAGILESGWSPRLDLWGREMRCFCGAGAKTRRGGV